MQRIGIDTGGTFTDVVLLDRGKIQVHKLPSTPDDPARAVLDGLAEVRRGKREVDVVHGTTVGLNAILTGRTAKVAFVTNRGFRDLIEIARQDRQGIYDLQASKAVLPVPRNLRFEVDSRRSTNGESLEQPSKASLKDLLAKLRKRRIHALAIGLLHSYANPRDEIELARALKDLGLPITCSAELLPIAGEYERFSSAILNAGIQPIMGEYLGRLQVGVRPGRLRMMRSSSGIMSAGEASKNPARAVFSGPAGGVLATERLAESLGEDRMAALDMGGTSTDVSLINPGGGRQGISSVAGLPLAIPAVDVHTVGCGGGSIAYADGGKALRVGPMSAGADPGPACYGRGDQPTVTDAHLALGHLGPDTLLAGAFPVDPERSVATISDLARKLGMTARACAEGIIEIAEVAIMRALMVITVERSVDPAKIPLVAYGGAAGLHAAAIIRRLDMPYALVPIHPGAFSALGLALAGETQETNRPVLRTLSELSQEQMKSWMEKLRSKAIAGIEDGNGSLRFRGDCLLRFRGQGAGLWLSWGRKLEEAFRQKHQEQFGFLPESAEVELVEMRARIRSPSRRYPHGIDDVSKRRKAPAVVREAPLGDKPVRTYARTDICEGERIPGPALIEEFSSTTLIPSGFICTSTAFGLRIERT
jgi:N-methylhydantoinase A